MNEFIYVNSFIDFNWLYVKYSIEHILLKIQNVYQFWQLTKLCRSNVLHANTDIIYTGTKDSTIK